MAEPFIPRDIFTDMFDPAASTLSASGEVAPLAADQSIPSASNHIVLDAMPTSNVDEDSDDNLYLTWPPAGRNDIVEDYTPKPLDGPPTRRLEEDHQNLAVSSPLPVSDIPEEIVNPEVANLDLASSLQGFYRILDLISEQGSGGTVDKVIIAQDSLRDFLNTISPGCYTSLTKVDYKALDNLAVKPIGLYGSKEEIVKVLRTIQAADETTFQMLLSRTDEEPNSLRPSLRSGLYILRSSRSSAHSEQLYVIYWPEDTTWDDAAISSVRRNRVTFMRYLTKICDQIVALVSSKHAEALVWKNDNEESATDTDNDVFDRLFAFEVSQTNEQQEDVKTRPGIQMVSRHIALADVPPECMVDPSYFQPRLLAGELVQGFITTKYKTARRMTERLKQIDISSFQLRKLLERGTLRFNAELNETALQALVSNGLGERFPDDCTFWFKRKHEALQSVQTDVQGEEMKINARLEAESPQLQAILHETIIDVVISFFPTFTRTCLGSEREGDSMHPIERLAGIVALYPRIGELFRRVVSGADLSKITSRVFLAHKERLITVAMVLRKRQSLPEDQRQELVRLILNDGDKAQVRDIVGDSEDDIAVGTGPSHKPWSMKGAVLNFFKAEGEEPPTEHKLIVHARHFASTATDVEFLSRLNDIRSREPMLRDAVAYVETVAVDYFKATISNLLQRICRESLVIQQDDCKKQFKRETASRTEQIQHNIRVDFIRTIEAHSRSDDNLAGHVIESINVSRRSYSHESYQLTGLRESFEDPMLEYTIHTLNLTEGDQQVMQLNPAFIPSPAIHDNCSHSFRLPVGYSIAHAQLLDHTRLLLVVLDRSGNLLILSDALAGIDGAIKRERYRILNRDKIGQDFLLAFDESKRTLAVCASQKLQLHVFVFDETYRSMQAFGSAVNLMPWYNDNTLICHACFICGTEELLLVDSGGQGRIFSLVTLQFRPASLIMPQLPTAVYSSPDGACLLVAYPVGTESHLIAYHWSTFGSTNGISLYIADVAVAEVFVLTSFVIRSSVHLARLDITANLYKSVALDITKNVTEFMFKEKNRRADLSTEANHTIHNCLIDCYADVWTRFPVLPAVRRQTISSFSERSQKTLMFVTNRDHQHFPSYFTELIRTFENITKKPTGDELKSIVVSAIPFGTFAEGVIANPDWNISSFRAGEWLVDICCLIPIHLAITKENRFVPLKDGVSSADLEKSLLGAEVSRIVDSLSFGWYESLFQSYMASKPVKVVSSMGEQSVGKSFALNHLVDTSFAGSAMRTTEGVWMSVTPTDDALIVALDFEGVHSIERSAQEDTLLVLFNTAISNLVLFRNNFALSRDIAGLFQSFQSSSTVLDPAANPSLFQSTLVIIIKDVVDSDKAEIAREFSLKFRKIVHEEQDANFISRLHAGKLNIIPWPVIESKEFYKLFPALKQHLDQQPVTHNAAGEFLHTLKTLMAKLKANDWGSMSQTLAAHRAQYLLSFLHNALTFGQSEVEPGLVPLKNFDTDLPVESSDTSSTLFVSGAGVHASGREQILSALRSEWDQTKTRQYIPDTEWVSNLGSYLESIVNHRVDHVRAWIDSNLLRFRTGHASIDELRRTFEGAILELKVNVQLCSLQCTSCHLLCVGSRFHDGGHSCHTDHECLHRCSFCDDLSYKEKACNMPAGHPGKHICVVNAHLCGEPCALIGKRGCLNECTKVVGHQENHTCSASVHTCGEPCDLAEIELADGQIYSCIGECAVPSSELHTRHACASRMCPVTCQLCKRLCSNEDHLHGLTPGAVHLCGQEHVCTALCSDPGICEIDTAPQSIEATFTGKHETFQYTKYSQVAKRLRCIKSIAPGAIDHPPPHNHSAEQNPFHFCEIRCDNCGYFCTLPLGHSQQEHETRHGSMSHTRWAVDGPEDACFELEGRKFSSNDDGAPMMCNLVCQAMGRHVHIDYCRAAAGTSCEGNDIQHILTRMIPSADRAKDAVTHSLHWRRMGFKDPYSRDDQANFAKCDAMCSGPEHATTTTSGGQPSYWYVSHDGHHFSCKNPVVMQQAFHVIFVIDRSGSMNSRDRRPLPNVPASDLIRQHSDNRLGAVYSSLHSFWTARHSAITAGQQANPGRRDSYSVILFHSNTTNSITNDFTSTPDQLLAAVLPFRAGGATNFAAAFRTAQTVMETNWSSERTPVVIFLSDGIDSITDQRVQDLCRSAVQLGKPLSFHSVSFGQENTSASLRRMAQIALEVQNSAPRDPLAPAAAIVLSSYAEALDTVRLAETFLGIAESLRKPRGSLLR